MRHSRRMLIVAGMIAIGGRYLFLIVLALAIAQAQEFPSQDASAGISFEHLMSYLRMPGRDGTTDAMATKIIERFGLSFRPTADELASIRNLSAESSLINTIESARMPPERPPLINAGLAIHCEPVDCDVWIDDRSIGHTSGGVLPWVTVNPGKIRIRAERTNYEAHPDPIEIDVGSGERIEVPFKFQPSRPFLVDLGTRYLAQTIEGLGDMNADGSTMRATGSLYLHDEAGFAAWSIVAWIDAGGLSRVDLTRLHQKHIFSRTSSGSWKDSVTRPSQQLGEAIALLDSALLLQRVKSLRTGTVVASDPDEMQHRFRITGPDGVYLVTLDFASHPGKIEHHPEGNIPGTTYLYSEYAKIAGSSWPANIEVVPSGNKLAISARFMSMQQTATPAPVAGRPSR